MGTILRVHRGDVKKQGNKFQINCDANIKAAWALFDPVESDIPLRYKGRKYTFIEADKKRLKELRAFSKGFFETYDVLPLLSSLKKPKKDIDMVCDVLHREEGHNYDKVRVHDGDRFYKFAIPHNRFSYIGPRDIVYIRGLTIVKGKCKVDECTGILKIPVNYLTAHVLGHKIDSQLSASSELRRKFLAYHPKIGELGENAYTIVSQVLNDKLEFVSLKQLFSLAREKVEGKTFRVKVTVLVIGPKDATRWLIPTKNRPYIYYNL